MAKLKVGIYRVVVSEGTIETLPGLFRYIEQLPDDHSRAYMLSDEPIRPRSRQISINSEYCFADFSRIRQIGELPLSNIAGEEETLVFEPGGKQPAERTAILLDPKCACFFVHEHAGGISASAFGRYFRSVGVQAYGTQFKLRIEPVLKQEALERFAKQKHHTRIKVRLAGMDNTTFLRNQGLAATPLLSMIDFFHSPTLKIEASIGATRETVGQRLSNVGETVTALLGLRATKQLKQLIVLGHDDQDAGDFPVDFIKDRSTFVWEVQCERGKALTDANRYRAVTEAWREHREELRARFDPISSDVGTSV